jgi:hypothetical protein
MQMNIYEIIVIFWSHIKIIIDSKEIEEFINLPAWFKLDILELDTIQKFVHIYESSRMTGPDQEMCYLSSKSMCWTIISSFSRFIRKTNMVDVVKDHHQMIFSEKGSTRYQLNNIRRRKITEKLPMNFPHFLASKQRKQIDSRRAMFYRRLRERGWFQAKHIPSEDLTVIDEVSMLAQWVANRWPRALFPTSFRTWVLFGTHETTHFGPDGIFCIIRSCQSSIASTLDILVSSWVSWTNPRYLTAISYLGNSWPSRVRNPSH